MQDPVVVAFRPPAQLSPERLEEIIAQVRASDRGPVQPPLDPAPSEAETAA